MKSSKVDGLVDVAPAGVGNSPGSLVMLRLASVWRPSGNQTEHYLDVATSSFFQVLAEKKKRDEQV
jgi:hypothetical protein